MNFKEFKNKYQKQEVQQYPHQVHSTPLVSVLVQTYQHKNFIKACLDSILSQETNFPFEILLGEDASEDGTREICISYAEKYPQKIRLFLHHPDNKIKVLGITTGNFNSLYNFYSSNGEYIAFCEGDDLWKDPLKLQVQVDFLKSSTDLAFTYHSFKEVNYKNEPLLEEFVLEQPTKDISKEDLKKLTFHPLLSTMCFRNLGKELAEQMAEVINVDSFLLSLLGNYGAAGFLDTINPSFYRRHEGGMWSGKLLELRLRSKILLYSKLQEYYRHQKDKMTMMNFKVKEKHSSRSLFLNYLKQNQHKNAFRLLKAIF